MWTEISARCSARARSSPASTSAVLCTQQRATPSVVPAQREARAGAPSTAVSARRRPTGPSSVRCAMPRGAHRWPRATCGRVQPALPPWSRTPGAHGPTRPRTRLHRRAGRRSRTVSGSRSWSRPACMDTARSPRKAACRSSLVNPSRQLPHAGTRSSPSPAPRAARRLSALERLVAEPDPAATGIVLLDHRAPGRDRHPVLGGAAPGHRDHLEAVRAVEEDVAVEMEAERDLAVLDGVEVLRRRDLEVVRARNLDRERRRPRERRHGRRHPRPREHRVAGAHDAGGPNNSASRSRVSASYPLRRDRSSPGP